MNLVKPLVLIGIVAATTPALEHFGPRLLAELQRPDDYETLPQVQPLPPATPRGSEQLLPDQPTKHGALQTAKRLVMNALPLARQVASRSIAEESQDYVNRYGHLPNNFYFGSARTTPVAEPPADPNDQIGQIVYVHEMTDGR